MLNLAHVERIQGKLLQVPAIVDLQQARSSSFCEAVLRWLNETETELKNAQLSAVSGLAALRSRLLMNIHGDGVQTRSRKARDAAAAQALQDAQRSISTALEPALARLNEAEQLAYKVIAVARAKGLLQALVELSHTDALIQLSACLQRDPDTVSAMVHIVGLVGRFDSLVVLDRATPELT